MAASKLAKAARSTVVGAANAFTAARRDRVLATNLLQLMQDKRGCYKYAAGVYDNRHHCFLVPMLVLSCLACLITMFWGDKKHIDTLMIVISSIGALNLVLTSVSSLLKNQSKAQQCELAASQYDVIASQLSFATQHLIGLDRARLVQLTKDAEQRHIDVRGRSPPISAELEKSYHAQHKPSSFDDGLGGIEAPQDDDANDGGVLEASNDDNPELAEPPTDADFQRLEGLRDTLVKRRGAFEYAAYFYSKRLYCFLVASLVLSGITAMLASGWDGTVRAYQAVVVVINAINVIVVGLMNQAKYQYKVDSATNAAAQYDVLVSKASFARRFSLSLKHSTVTQLALDTEKADNDIRKNAIPLPQQVEREGIAYAKEIEKAKSELLAKKGG